MDAHTQMQHHVNLQTSSGLQRALRSMLYLRQMADLNLQVSTEQQYKFHEEAHLSSSLIDNGQEQNQEGWLR